MKIKNSIIIGSVVLGSLLMSGVAFAQTPWGGNGGYGRMGAGMGTRAPGVFGTVTAINGTSLTVTSKGFGQNPTQTAYTVDATNATVTKAGAASTVGNIIVGDTVSVSGTVSGTSVTATAIRDGVPQSGRMGGPGMMGRAPGVFGTVASVSGNTITVTSKVGPNGGTASTYTVDATNATVTKGGATSSVAGIAVGDAVMVQGTVSGTSVTATAIRDGIPQGGAKGATRQNATPLIQGNGQPVIGGTVTAVSGMALTVTNKSNVTYAVDATNARIVKGGATSSVAGIVVGDNVIVQGTVNGSSVTASSVMDSGAAQANARLNTTTGAQPKSVHRGSMGGFFGAIGGFFHNLFGFF